MGQNKISKHCQHSLRYDETIDNATSYEETSRLIFI